MKVLVTGALGFVGRYMGRALQQALGRREDLVLTARQSAVVDDLGDIAAFDVTDVQSAERIIADIQPTHVVHLAGLSTIAAASQDEQMAWRIHVHGTLGIARAILRHAPQCVLIHAGSGQIYGFSGRSGAALSEQTLLAPNNIQMVTKSAIDLALGALAEDGLRCVRFRPFNHTGPTQSVRFALPNFARQIALIKHGRQHPLIRVGNLETERDFLDVRDIVSGYLQAVLKSDELEPGVIFNLASGIPRRMQDILATMFALSGVAAKLEVDPSLLRPGEIPRFVGDASKARRFLAWSPQHPFEQTLKEIVEHWDRAIAEGADGT